MATNSIEAEEKLKDLIDCCICTETLKNPRILPCVHSFCEKCLEAIGTKNGKNPGELMPCPVCRKEFTIPEDGFTGLQKNFFIERLIDLKKILNPLSDSGPCTSCFKSMDPNAPTELPPASMFCVDCHEKMCTECCAQHKKFKLMMNHRLITMNSSEEKLMESVVPQNVCEKHQKNPINVFCSSCSEALCSYCFFEGHKTHEGSTLEQVVGTLRVEILENIESLSTVHVGLGQKVGELNESKTEFVKNVEGLESEIKERLLALKELLDKDSELLLSRVNRAKEERLKESEAKKDDIERLLISVDGFRTYCQKVTSMGSVGDICMTFRNLKMRAVELKQKNDALPNNFSEIKNISFNKTLLEDFLINKNIIGKLTGTNDEWEAVIAKENSSEVNEKPGNDDNLQLPTIDALTNENQELKTVNQKFENENQELKTANQQLENETQELKTMNQTFVNETQELKTMKQKLEDQMKDLEKQVTLLKGFGDETKSYSPEGTTDYNYAEEPDFHSVINTLGDIRGHEAGLAILGNELFVVVNVEVVEIYDVRSLMFKRRWKLENVSSVSDVTQCARNECLYILASKENFVVIRFDPKGNVISSWPVTGRGKLSTTAEGNVLFMGENQNELHEYAPDGTLVRTIPLSWNTGIEHPLHAIMLTSCHFLISHGLETDRLRRVCIVDDTGDVLNYIRDVFQNPGYLHVDSNGNILVADHISGQLVALSPDLKVLGTFSSAKPSRMIVDEVNGRLFMIEDQSTGDTRFENCRLSVYVLKKNTLEAVDPPFVATGLMLEQFDEFLMEPTCVHDESDEKPLTFELE